MNPDIIIWAWVIGGFLLIAFEAVLPQFYTGFFGAGALLVALLMALGFLANPATCLLVWFASSLLFLFALRHVAIRYLHAESSYQSTDEDFEAVGQIVEVVTPVSEADENGRVRFRGTTWPAISTTGTILAGQKARLLYRDNLLWKVEPYTAEDEPRQKTPLAAERESS